MYTNHVRYMRTEDLRSERRIRRNRVRRQREMMKNFLILVMTVCLIVTCSVALSSFRSNAKADTALSYKYYKSIVVSNNDTLWSIAEEYMDREHYTSINEYIKEVKAMNSLSGDSIQYGRHLVIPYYGTAFSG
ncbi:MAG: LysM peptidoglycan-binding domain-containing protein [Lachnospiraceae bacterium]|nr:LysM peptidoglycan-binding domain-containing protein [Lachnospiraceae bacterium]